MEVRNIATSLLHHDANVEYNVKAYQDKFIACRRFAHEKAKIIIFNTI